MNPVTCQATKLGGTCTTHLYWLKSVATGKPAPIDAEVTDPEESFIAIFPQLGTYEIVKDYSRRREMVKAGITFHKSHFATCKDAALFRQQKARA